MVEIEILFGSLHHTPSILPHFPDHFEDAESKLVLLDHLDSALFFFLGNLTLAVEDIPMKGKKEGKEIEEEERREVGSAPPNSRLTVKNQRRISSLLVYFIELSGDHSLKLQEVFIVRFRAGISVFPVEKLVVVDVEGVLELFPDLQSSEAFEFVTHFRECGDFVGPEDQDLSLLREVAVVDVELGFVLQVDHHDELYFVLVDEVEEVSDGVCHGHLSHEVLQRPIFEENVVHVVPVQIPHVNQFLMLEIRVCATEV